MSTQIAKCPPDFLAVDFYCGAGGTTRGLIDAGGYVLAGIDSDKVCEATYVTNNKNKTGDLAAPCFLNYDLFPKKQTYPDGQQEVALCELGKLLRDSRSAYQSTPLLFSICAPCQPFARLTKTNVSDDRYRKHIRDRSLLLQTLVFVKRFSPDMIFCENIAAIASSKFGEVWRKFAHGLERLGYHTGSDIVNAENFGIAQSRRRSIILAVKEHTALGKKPIRVVAPIDIPLRNPRARPKTVSQVLQGLPPIKAGERHPRILNHQSRALSEQNFKRLSSALPGETNAYLHNTKYGDLSLDCHNRMADRAAPRGFHDVYTRMHPDRPSPTITTRCVSVSNGRFGHYDINQVRPISIREAALLQSFPRNYVFLPKDNLEATARMVGNAVPPRLARFFARYLVKLQKSFSKI